MLYDKLKNEEDHFRYDAELLLYEPSFKTLDANNLTKDYAYRVSGGQAGEKVDLSREQYETLLNNLQHKNGFVMAVYEFTVMNAQLNEMKELCQSLIRRIDRELETGNSI